MAVMLVPMTAAEFAAWLPIAIRDYAADNVAIDRWAPQEAEANAAAEFHDLLPAGVATPDHHLFTIRDAATGATVGMIWFAVVGTAPRQYAFVYDFMIDAPVRRRGYGAQAFTALEQEVRARGLHRIGLHVFGNNAPARALYQKLGYRETSVNMLKDLPD